MAGISFARTRLTTVFVLLLTFLSPVVSNNSALDRWTTRLDSNN
jgi:hypothetical protein